MIVKIKQRESKPLMDDLYNQILEESKNPKKSIGIRGAVNYALKEWNESSGCPYRVLLKIVDL
ncbi:MAG: hypothetical protein KDK54_21065 [Leptospiraceae bacterium]|nr:hypothetical protein [Leptospiraceae bacterium]